MVINRQGAGAILALVIVLVAINGFLMIENHGITQQRSNDLEQVVTRMVDINIIRAQFVAQHRDTIAKINPKIDIVDCVSILQSVYDNCMKYDLDPELVLSVIEQESQFVRNANGGAGEIGLMQILPSTGLLVGHYLGLIGYDLYEIDDNITLGCAYLSMLSQWRHNERFVLAAYNAGKNTKAGLKYADKVIRRKAKWVPDEM